MARLQDFQSVTPAGSDNLLIVQSQGQGLATLNAVGQKIATDTDISSLATTSKKTAGAINELKAVTDNCVRVATFSFNKTIAATTQVTYNITRSDFNLPANAKAVSVFLRENLGNSVNAGGLIYSAYVNPTATVAVEGAIFNGTGIQRTYPITATLFYTLT